VNALGLFLGIACNKSTPDLYVNNAHHKIGWIATWVVIGQVVIRLIYIYSEQGRVMMGAKYQRLTFLPVSAEDMMEGQNLHPSGSVHEHCWSGDSGQDINHPTTPDNDHEGFRKPEDDELEDPTPLTCGWLRRSSLDRFFSMRVPDLVSSRVLRTFRIIYKVIDRIILPFGFAVLMTGGVTYGGIFVSTSQCFQCFSYLDCFLTNSNRKVIQSLTEWRISSRAASSSGMAWSFWVVIWVAGRISDGPGILSLSILVL
jgi:hypothetical protein